MATEHKHSTNTFLAVNLTLMYCAEKARKETLLNYAKARYQDPSIGFNSTDAMWWKYPTRSPYTYCANNPVNKVDPSGMYFGEVNEKTASKIEQKASKRATRLENKADRLEAKGKDAGDLRERAGELRQSAQDIRDMRGDKTTEYRYGKASSKDNPSGRGLPTTTLTGTNSTGDNVVTMFTESNMGSKLHESRHGGQNVRGEYNIVTGAGYGVADEVSAYRAQFSWNGELTFIDVNKEPTLQEMFDSHRTGTNPLLNTIKSIYLIVPSLINRLVDHGFVPVYPPTGIPLDIWNSN